MESSTPLIISSCLESMKYFQQIQEQTFETWRHLYRLTHRALIFEPFLLRCQEDETLLPTSPKEILIHLQKLFKCIEKLIDDVIKRPTIRGFTEPKTFQDHFIDITTAYTQITQYGEALNLLEDQNYTQLRAEDLEDIKETFKYAVMESLREMNEEAVDRNNPMKGSSYSVSDEIHNLQRDIDACEDAIVKLLSARKARALSIGELKTLKTELQKLLLIVNERGAEIEYTRIETNLIEENKFQDDLISMETDEDEIENNDFIIKEISLSFLRRFHRGHLSKKDLFRKKDYIERQRLLPDELEIGDTIVTTWAMGDVMLGKMDNRLEVAVKTMRSVGKPNKKITENQIHLLETELLTLQFLNRAGGAEKVKECFVCCHGALVKGTSSIQLIMELAPYGSLEDMLYDEKLFTTFPIALKCAWISDLAEGLQFLYQRDIIHGNVQAKNLYVFEKMKIKLGNFHIPSNDLKNERSGNVPTTTNPFLPPEAREENKEIDISFDIFSFAMTVIQIFSRKKPLIDNFQQQIVQSLQVAGLNAMDIRNRLFTVLSDCVKTDPSLPPKEIRPTGEKIRNEMIQILKTFGDDPRSHESQRSYMVKLEAMALEKRKQMERKRHAKPEEGWEFQLTSTEYVSSSDKEEEQMKPKASQPPTTIERQNSECSISTLTPPIQYHELSSDTTPPPELSSKSDSNPLPNNHQLLNSSFDSSSSYVHFLERPNIASSSSMDEEHVTILSSFIRNKVQCTRSHAKKVALLLVDSGILDAEILKRRLQRDRNLLFNLGVEEELADELNEVLVGSKGSGESATPRSTVSGSTATSSAGHRMSMRSVKSVPSFDHDSVGNHRASPRDVRSPRLLTPTTVSSEKRISSRVSSLGNLSQNGRKDSYNNNYRNNNNRTPIPANSTADEIAKLYYAATQLRDVNAFQKLSDYSSIGDQIAEGFMMRIHALGQCTIPKDHERANRIARKIFHWLQKIVERNVDSRSMYACYHLAVCYSEGLGGMEQNHTMAFQYYQESAELGYVGAQAYVGFCHFMGIGVPKNYSEAVQWYRVAADQGFAGAQSNLATCYENGQGVRKNMEMAVKYYRLSAEQGTVSSQYKLGQCYEKGEGIKQSYSDSAKWYLVAVQQGYVLAEYALGLYFLNGHGVNQDLKKGIFLLTRAAEKGYTLAQLKLGECYEEGSGVTKNPVKAVSLYYQAAESGDANALYHLGYYYSNGITVERNLSKAVEYFTLAAEQHHPVALFQLGLCYLNGLGTRKDPVRAMEYFSMSAKEGYGQAEYQIGICYEKGLGVNKNRREAMKHYEIAMDLGNLSAEKAISQLTVTEENNYNFNNNYNHNINNNNQLQMTEASYYDHHEPQEAYRPSSRRIFSSSSRNSARISVASTSSSRYY